MKVVQYKTEEERMEAVRRMIGMRQVFEARVRELMAKRKDHPLHNQVICSFHDFILVHSQA